jgi:hypothetical protein
LKGHDFSRAAKKAKTMRALAPEEMLAGQQDFRRNFLVSSFESQGGVIAMDETVFTVLVSGAVALVTVIVTQPLTYFFNRKRDHEADWRKLKLEYYKEFVTAMHNAAKPYADTASENAAKQRYSEASANLHLVAPPNVLTLLNDFHSFLASGGGKSETDKVDAMQSTLMRAMRKDCQPKDPRDPSDLMFKGIVYPPQRQRSTNGVGGRREQS